MDIVRLDENSFIITITNQTNSSIILHKELISGLNFEILDEFMRPLKTQFIEGNTIPFDKNNFIVLPSGESLSAKFSPQECFYCGHSAEAILPVIDANGDVFSRSLPYVYSDIPVRILKLPKDFYIKVSVCYDDALCFLLKYSGFDEQYFPKNTFFLFRVSEVDVQSVLAHEVLSNQKPMSVLPPLFFQPPRTVQGFPSDPKFQDLFVHYTEIAEAKGFYEGRVKGQIESLLLILAKRLGNVPLALHDRLCAIHDLDILGQLTDVALDCQTLGEFEEVLNR